MSSSTSWLSYLNTVPALDGGNQIAEEESATATRLLSEDLRSQLEAWTTVTFEDSSLHGGAAAFQQHGDGLGQLFESSKTQTDPNPYAKKSFGSYSHPAAAQLERGFSAFTAESNLNNADNGFGAGYNSLAELGVGVDGSNTLFADPVSVKVSSRSLPNSPSDTAHNRQRTKKQRTRPSSPTVNAPGSIDPSISPPISAGNAIQVSKQPLLTKAAILAAQAAELAAQKAATPEQEAARLAELNRIAAEDDKRRRNTAASARFRVKKKQREHALEDTVSELTTKIDKLEKNLEASRVENNFLRDLVIRKVGLADLPVPNIGGALGKISGGQEGATGMGTLGI